MISSHGWTFRNCLSKALSLFPATTLHAQFCSPELAPMKNIMWPVLKKRSHSTENVSLIRKKQRRTANNGKQYCHRWHRTNEVWNRELVSITETRACTRSWSGYCKLAHGTFQSDPVSHFDENSVSMVQPSISSAAFIWGRYIVPMVYTLYQKQRWENGRDGSIWIICHLFHFLHKWSIPNVASFVWNVSSTLRLFFVCTFLENRKRVTAVWSRG